MPKIANLRGHAVAILTSLALLGPEIALAADPHRQTCTKTVHVPARTHVVHDVVTIPGRTIDTIVPTHVRPTTRRIVTQTPRTRIVTHAPRYDDVTTHVRTPDRIIERHIPARTKRVRRKVMVAPGRTVHKPCVKHGHHTTCAVHLPPQYGYRTETVVVEHARVEHRQKPGRIERREHRVLVAPGAIERIHEGPRYASVQVAVPEIPAHLRRRHVPARHKTVARKVVTPAHTKTVHVPCGH